MYSSDKFLSEKVSCGSRDPVPLAAGASRRRTTRVAKRRFPGSAATREWGTTARRRSFLETPGENPRADDKRADPPRSRTEDKSSCRCGTSMEYAGANF